jgi:nicotinate-nucleotide adenylyltransferase
MQKIAVFGGTFNPIHNGHIHLAKRFAEILDADLVLLIPTNVPPHKQAPDLACASDRLAMCSLAAESDGLFRVSDLEIRRGGSSYTSDTLCQLRELYPGSPLFLITGEDMFVTLEQWHNTGMIYRLATVCAAPRSPDGMTMLQQYAEKLKKKGARTRIENISYLPVSSTMVREAVKAGRSISSFVPAAVEQYIMKKNLYRE